jgi:hypothetical protein
MTEHKYANTSAAMMLAAGLRWAAQEWGLSLREIGRRLGYRQPVVLSHMASGRVPIPIDRAVTIAEQVGLAPGEFLEAVLHQHHPAVDWNLIAPSLDTSLRELQSSGGSSQRKLASEHGRILREVVEDTRPEERWLSNVEIPVVKFLRRVFPTMQTDGLSEDEWDALRLAAHLTNAEEDQAGHRPATKQGDKNEC